MLMTTRASDSREQKRAGQRLGRERQRLRDAGG